MENNRVLKGEERLVYQPFTLEILHCGNDICTLSAQDPVENNVYFDGYDDNGWF